MLKITYLIKESSHCVKKLYYLRLIQWITLVIHASTGVTKHGASIEGLKNCCGM